MLAATWTPAVSGIASGELLESAESAALICSKEDNGCADAAVTRSRAPPGRSLLREIMSHHRDADGYGKRVTYSGDDWHPGTRIAWLIVA